MFTNTHKPSEEGFAQIYQALRKGYRIPIFVFAACFTLYGGYHLVRIIRWMIESGESLFNGPSFWFVIAEMAFMILMIVWETTAPKRYAKRQMRRVSETYNGRDPAMTATFYDDGIEFHNAASGSTTHMEYSRFVKCRETKDLFLLCTQQKQYIDLKKDGFSGIDAAGFRAFMDEKMRGVQASLKKEKAA